MEKHNILGKKAEASAALKEKLISIIAWIFILFCIYFVVYLSKIGLQALFLNSNKHFTLEAVHITAKGLPENTQGLVDIEDLEDSLDLHIGADNLFELDLQKIRRRVNRDIRIKTSEVSYLFPDTIKIEFIEKDPVARLLNRNLIDYDGQVIPSGRNDLQLPVIAGKDYNPGEIIDSENIQIPLKFIRFHEGFRMFYDPIQAITKDNEVAALELIKIKMISLNKDNTLGVILRASPTFMVADNARLKLPADDFEVGLRRACIAIMQNALVRKETNKIDARYSSTPTE
ncbi:MAG: FtsQ-type POTRA domain-containing protein [Lentisphaeraceae bacterium]|nr:FtsQ-type POTRA domain-containing protein [Lentisphaeraceae bacterium]